MHSTPPEDEINRIYFAIQEDRKAKTHRVREALSKIVGYRESQSVSQKCGVSGSTIKDIIEQKKEMAGYDVINRLELYLQAVMPDFELSIENPLTLKDYTRDYLGELIAEMDRTADFLKDYCCRLTNSANKMKKEIDWQGSEVEPTDRLRRYIKSLSEIETKIDTYWKIYIDKKV
jgi:hypothetical protein